MDESHTTSRGDGRGRGAERGAFGPTATSAATAPDPEVPAKAERRRFTAEYRLRILKQADACKRQKLAPFFCSPSSCTPGHASFHCDPGL